MLYRSTLPASKLSPLDNARSITLYSSLVQSQSGTLTKKKESIEYAMLRMFRYFNFFLNISNSILLFVKEKDNLEPKPPASKTKSTVHFYPRRNGLGVHSHQFRVGSSPVSNLIGFELVLACGQAKPTSI